MIGESRNNSGFIGAVGLVTLTLVVYIPAMRGGFVWDDDSMLTNNIILEENGLYRSWFTNEQCNYWPVTLTSYWLEFQFWGLNPIGYHVVNVLLHAACALLILRILTRLKIPGAWLAAFVFAVHPVNVESVAWITQRKTTLSVFFYLIALLWYLRFDEHGHRRWYWLAVASFILAMLSKGVVVALPVVLLMCAWWLHNTISRRDILRSLPFFAVSALMSAVEIWFQSVQVIGGDVVRDDSFFARLVGASRAVWFYLYKAILPINLSFVYPRWDIDPTNWFSYYIPILVMPSLLVLCWRYRRSWGRPMLFALGYYVVTLLPVLGFFDIYFMRYSLVADHYQYVSIIGIVALVVAVSSKILKRLRPSGARLAYAGAAAAVVILGLLTWHQGHIYKDKETLWRDTLSRNPDCWLANVNYGQILYKRGQPDEAIRHYRVAMQVEPDYWEPYFYMGMIMFHLEQFDKAIGYFHGMLQSRSKMNNKDKKVIDYKNKRVLLQRADTAAAVVYDKLGTILLAQGKLDEAIDNFRQSLEIHPFFATAHANLGKALLQKGQLQEAINYLREAVQLDQKLGEAHNYLAQALLRQDRTDESIWHWREALRINPNDDRARRGLKAALAREDKSGKRKKAR